MIALALLYTLGVMFFSALTLETPGAWNHVTKYVLAVLFWPLAFPYALYLRGRSRG